MKTRSPNSTYYRNKADSLFMAQFRGMNCEVCGTHIGTCGHHIVSKGRSKALRYDIKNIVVVCPSHHTMGNDKAPHSTNTLAVERFIEWFKAKKPEQYEYVTENERVERRYTYKQAVENMKAGRLAWL